MDHPCRLRMRPMSAPCEIATRRRPETWKFEWSDIWSKGIDSEPGEPQPSIRFSNCWKPPSVLSPSRSDTTDSTMFSNHCKPRSVEGVDAMSGLLPPPEPISVLVVTDPPLMTGGSVTSVPPWPSEVALKFDVV